MEHADVVLRFLESVGQRADAEFYLALFRAVDKERFAAISVDANVARHATEAVVLDLHFLASLGLSPVVMLGLIDPGEAIEQATRIQRKLTRGGVPAEVLPAAALGGGLAASVTTLARSGAIAVVPFNAAAGASVDERFERAGALLSALGMRKLIFLHRPGGLRQHGSLVRLVNLTTDYAALATSRELSRKERVMLQQSQRLVLERGPQRLLVSITSPFDLLRELFTVKGAGTLMRRGAVIERRGGFDDVDRERLAALVASSFGRQPREGYFATTASRIYLEESYRGAAILMDTPLGPYLSKFAVDREAQGEGIGRDLWDALAAEQREVFWRARAENPIVAWYAQLCDGLQRVPGWHVFWRGLPIERVPDAVRYALAQPEDIPRSGAAPDGT